MANSRGKQFGNPTPQGRVVTRGAAPGLHLVAEGSWAALFANAPPAGSCDCQKMGTYRGQFAAELLHALFRFLLDVTCWGKRERQRRSGVHDR